MTSNDQNSRVLFQPIKKEFKTTPKKFYQNSHPHIFFGYFFACSNFRHKAMNYRSYGRKNLRVKNYNLKDNQTVDQVKRKIINPLHLYKKGN